MPVRSALLSMFADSDLCLWWQDPADGRVRWSRGTAAALGLPRSRRPDDEPSLLERLHPDDRQPTLDVIREAMTTRRSFSHEYRLLTEQGEEWCLMRGGYHSAPDHGDPLLLGTIEFITTIREQAARLQASEERLRLTVSAGEMGLWDWDIASDRIAWSERVYTLMGVETSVEPTFATFTDALHPEDRPRVVEAVQTCVETGGDYAIDFRVVLPDGAERWIQANGKPSVGADGRVEGMLGCILDITPRKRAEAALQREMSAAASLLHAKQSFLAAMSHEVRTPLTAILGFAELLALRIDQEPLREQARTIERSAQRLKRMLDDVLDVARIDAGAVTLRPESIAVERVVERVEPVGRILAQSKGIAFTVAAASPDAMVMADADRLEQVLLNLITNAVKFTERGGVTLRTETTAETVRIVVVDSGPGIDPEFLPHAFEPFRQQSSGHDRRFGGSGLGLSIARGLVQLMGGTLCLESRAGKGTTAIAELPRLPTAEIPPPSIGPDTEVEPAQDGARPRILVLEDDDATRTLIGRVLSEFAEVTATADSESALAALGEAVYDLLLFDIHLEGSPRDGLQTLTAARAEPLGSTAPAVAVTAFVDPAEVAALRRGGFAEVLGKPWSIADLRAAVRRHAERR